MKPSQIKEEITQALTICLRQFLKEDIALDVVRMRQLLIHKSPCRLINSDNMKRAEYPFKMTLQPH